MLILAVAFVAFPDRSDAILAKSTVPPRVEASGSLGLYYNGKCNPTYPNQTLVGVREYDWCSNIYNSNTDTEKPWIQFSIPNKAMKLTSYSFRNGCCIHYCCCNTESGNVVDYRCCCELYSFSLLGSNDNRTWKLLHKVEKDGEYIHYCEVKTYDLETKESFKYIRFVCDEPWPGCPHCMQLNQMEFYGQVFSSIDYGYDSGEEDNDESISIIGKVKNI